MFLSSYLTQQMKKVLYVELKVQNDNGQMCHNGPTVTLAKPLNNGKLPLI